MTSSGSLTGLHFTGLGNSKIGEIQPFKDLEVGLASCGIAPIRFDKVTLAHPKSFRNLKIPTPFR